MKRTIAYIGHKAENTASPLIYKALYGLDTNCYTSFDDKRDETLAVVSSPFKKITPNWNQRFSLEEEIIREPISNCYGAEEIKSDVNYHQRWVGVNTDGQAFRDCLGTIRGKLLLVGDGAMANVISQYYDCDIVKTDYYVKPNDFYYTSVNCTPLELDCDIDLNYKDGEHPLKSQSFAMRMLRRQCEININWWTKGGYLTT